MNPFFRNLFILIFVSCAVEVFFTSIYGYAFLGTLQQAVGEHTAALRSGVIPDAASIDLANDSWVSVARFETLMGQAIFAIDTIFSFVIAWFFMRRGMSRYLKEVSMRLSANRFVQRALYIALFTLVGAVVFFPQALSGFFIGQWRGTDVYVPITATAWDAVVGVALDVVYSILMFVPLYWIIEKYKSSWWIFGAVFVSLFTLFTSYIDPVVIQPIFSTVTPLEEGTLKQGIVELSEKADVPIERVYVNNISTQSFESNAMVYGIGSTKRIELDDTLLNFYTDDEILFIIGHEFGHYVHQDIIVGMLVSTAETFAFYGVLAIVLRMYVRRRGKREGVSSESDIVLFPLIGVTFTILGFVTTPFDSYISRTMEARADDYAIEIMPDTAAGISGFKKLAYQSFIDPAPPEWLHIYFDSHPTFAERISKLERARNIK